VNRGAFHCSKTEIEKHFQGYTRRMELFERFGLNLDWARRVLKKTTCFLPFQKQTNFPTAVALVLSP